MLFGKLGNAKNVNQGKFTNIVKKTNDLDTSVEQMGELRKAFKAIDVDNDGTISKDELTNLLKSRL